MYFFCKASDTLEDPPILEDPPDQIEFFTNNFWSLLTFLVFKFKIVSQVSMNNILLPL